MIGLTFHSSFFLPGSAKELTESWKAPFTARTCFVGSLTVTTLDGGVAKGVIGGHTGRACDRSASVP